MDVVERCHSKMKRYRNLVSYYTTVSYTHLYKEVWIGLGGTQSAVYATEVSAEEHLAYTTEETEKVEVYRLAEKLGDDIEAAIRQLSLIHILPEGDTTLQDIELSAREMRIGDNRLCLHTLSDAEDMPGKEMCIRDSLVATVVRNGIDQPIIFPSAHVAPRFLHRHII